MSQNSPQRPPVTREKLVLSAPTVAAISSTTTIPLGTVDGDFVIEKFEVEDPAGYTSDASNYYDISLQTKKRTFTAAVTDICTLTAHNFATGDSVQVTTSSALPTGLSISTTYYVVVLTANTFKLSDTLAHALAGTNIVDISGTGTGVQSMAKVHAMYSLVATTGNGDLVALTFAPATIQSNPTGLSGEQLNVVLTKLASGANLSAGARFIAHAHQL